MTDAVKRVLAAIVALPLTAFALMALTSQVRTGFDLFGAAFALCPGTMAALCWWFVLRGHIAGSRERMRLAVIGGLVVGGIAFAAGFFLPIVLKPEANQGPLLGIFITGPLGFVLGTAIGWIYGRVRARPAAP